MPRHKHLRLAFLFLFEYLLKMTLHYMDKTDIIKYYYFVKFLNSTKKNVDCYKKSFKKNIPCQ